MPVTKPWGIHPISAKTGAESIPSLAGGESRHQSTDQQDRDVTNDIPAFRNAVEHTRQASLYTTYPRVRPET